MPVQREISAKLPPKEGRNTEELNATVIVMCGETAEESIEMFGDDAVNSNAFANWRVTLQSNIRSSLGAGQDQDAIQEKLGSARMGVATAGGRVDPQAAFIAKFKMSTQEEQAEMLDALRTAAEG